jgi:1,4-dihydroxy-2-naphthoate polyprenyltransferase
LTPIQAWLKAFRLRTLPLAFSSILLGGFLAAKEGGFDGWILTLSLLTTLFLQVLSNLANDYGDYVKGTDNEDRIGPARTLQAGLISQTAMRNAIVLFALLSLCCGLSLLYVAGAFSNARMFWFFLGTGLFCILAAITYTVGKNAYGYKGLGDISVLLFFGLVGVLGTHFLMTQTFRWSNVLPALSCGLLAVGVLNLNNLRDIENDQASGKRSIPVMIGFEAGKNYHLVLVLLAGVLLLVFNLFFANSWGKYSILLLLPLYVVHVLKVKSTTEHAAIDPFLKQLALTSLASTFVLGLGWCF